MSKKIPFNTSSLSCLRDSTTYTVEAYNGGGYFIGGLDGGMSLSSKNEAAAIAAALNLACRYRALQRRTERLAAEVNAFLEEHAQ